MKKFKYLNARSVTEAVSLMQKGGDGTHIIAGGTDLLGQMQDNILPQFPKAIVNIKNLPGLDFILEEKGYLRIGALTRLEDIARNSTVVKKYPALAEAARRTASPHIREMGTIAGNICQSNRCWYYWSPHNRFNCLRKGGQACYALFGDGRYHSIFGSVKVDITPCSVKCPAGVEIPEYLGLIRQDNLTEAASILLDSNPLPAITGRVCPHFCEQGCNRQILDEAVSIRCVERFVGDYILSNPEIISRQIPIETGKRIAIAGSGPAGLAAAFYLRRSGHEVTIFEGQERAGGLLTYGIPAYRLPKDLVTRQIEALKQMGIGFRLNTRLGRDIRLEGLVRDYDAVFLACGAWKERASGIKGESAIISGTKFLCEMNMGSRQTPGSRVAIIGGGNVAIDVARVLKRLGAKPLVIYRRSRLEMPAVKEEVDKAVAEGVDFLFLTQPVEVIKQAQGVALKCLKMKLEAADSTGRPEPVPVAGSEFSLEMDAVIGAFGEEPDLSFVPKKLHSKIKTLKNDPSSFSLGANLFAGGDFIGGPSTVIQSIAAGRRAAGSIDRWLGGTGEMRKGTARGGNAEKFNDQFLKITPRALSPEIPVEKRTKTLDVEDTQTLSLDEINLEANRCFNCGCVAVNSSDLAPALVALDARIKTTQRTIATELFFSVKGDRTTILNDDEIVTEIQIPVLNPQIRCKFIKYALRKSIDFPIVNCAAAIESEEGKVKTARICLNAVFNQPYRAAAAEKYMTGKNINEANAEAAAAEISADTLPLVNNQYKIEIARALVKRSILGCK